MPKNCHIIISIFCSLGAFIQQSQSARENAKKITQLLEPTMGEKSYKKE